jgi:hypothetical protein
MNARPRNQIIESSSKIEGELQTLKSSHTALSCPNVSAQVIPAFEIVKAAINMMARNPPFMPCTALSSMLRPAVLAHPGIPPYECVAITISLPSSMCGRMELRIASTLSSTILSAELPSLVGSCHVTTS